MLAVVIHMQLWAESWFFMAVKNLVLAPARMGTNKYVRSTTTISRIGLAKAACVARQEYRVIDIPLSLFCFYLSSSICPW